MSASSSKGKEAEYPNPRAEMSLVPFPVPGLTGNIQLFDGRDATAFLERFERLARNYGLSDKQTCEQLPLFCAPSIQRWVKHLSSFTTGNWKDLQRDFLEEFRADDSSAVAFTQADHRDC